MSSSGSTLPPDGSSRRGAGPRGPYGTNEGDLWLAGDDSPIQRMLDADGSGMKLVHEMLIKDGRLQECFYVTDNEEMLEEARRGTELYWRQKASEN